MKNQETIKHVIDEAKEKIMQLYKYPVKVVVSIRKDPRYSIVVRKGANQIVELTADYFGIECKDITGKSRKREFVTARKYISQYCYYHLNPMYSLSEIGCIQGGRDHSTIINHHKEMENHLKNERETREDYENYVQFMDENRTIKN